MEINELLALMRRADEVKAELLKKIEEYEATHAEFIELNEEILKLKEKDDE